MADDRFAPVSKDGLERGWRCLFQFESPGTLANEAAVAAWAEETLTGLDLPQPRLERVRHAVERALVGFIGRAGQGYQAAGPRPPVLVRVMLPEGAAAQAGQPAEMQASGAEPGGRAWGLFVVERLDGALPTGRMPVPVIDVYLYTEGENEA